MKRSKKIIICMVFLPFWTYAGTINFQGNSSYLHVLNGATFVINQPISSMGGKLIQDQGGIISGANITFVDGLLQNNGNNMLLRAVLTPAGTGAGTLSINGSGNYIKNASGVINQTLTISGAGARIEGQPIFSGPITLQDLNTTVTFDIQSGLTTNIQFNPGATLYLDNDLTFADNSSFVGTGTIFFNRHAVHLGSTALSLSGNFILDANLTLNGPTTLTGNTTFTNGDTIQGNGNVLTLAAGATITIGAGANVFLTNTILKGVTNGSIIFSSATSQLTVSNSYIDLSGNVATSIGLVTFSGPSTIIEKGFTWTFSGSSVLTVDGVTVWMDQSGSTVSGNIVFASLANQSILNTGTLCDTVCGEIVDALISSTGFLQLEINALQTSTGFLESQISSLQTSTGLLQTELNAIYSSLSTSTGFLQLEINALQTSTGLLQSELDACCDALMSSTGFLQSELDFIYMSLSTSTGFLQLEINALQTSTGLLQSELDACCDALMSSTGFLQSELDFIYMSLSTSTGFLQLEINALQTSTGLLQSELDACCDALMSSTGFLQSELDFIYMSLSTSTGFLQSEINALQTSTGFLQSQIDSISTLTAFDAIIAQIDFLTSCCDALQTSTGFLQSQIDDIITCSNLCSRIDCLEINVAILIDEVEQLMSCCDVLTSKIDVCCTSTQVGPSNECTINVKGTMYWSLANIPATNGAVIFQFDPCYGEMCGPNPPKPTVIFDPAVFGNGGVVPIPASTRTIFSGEGIVLVKDGVTFDFQGTPFSDMSDWPALIIEELAQMDFDSSSTIVFGGQGGKFVVRSGATMNMDVPTHVIFGQNLFSTNILHWVDFAGNVTINNPDAQLSYQAGFFDILYSNHSTLDILSGTMEMNTLNGLSSPGTIQLMHFVDGSSLRIDKTGDPSVDGLLRFAPNFLNATVDFDNRAGITFLGDGQDTGGNIQFRNFDGSGNITVNTTTIIQDKHFAFVRTMLEVFMEYSFYLYRGLIQTPDATIMCRMGTIPNVNLDGNLAAFCPTLDGSIVALQQGDHDLFYDGLLIKGYDFANQLFIISNCDASTRVGG